MIYLVSYDDMTVDFTKEMAIQCPYIVDAFQSLEDLNEEQTLHAPFANGGQLCLLRALLKITIPAEVDIMPSLGEITIGGRPFRGQPFYSFVWCPELQTLLDGLHEEEITDLIYVLDDMCAWWLRNGVIYYLLHRHIKDGWKFERYFKSYRAKLAEIAYRLYETTICGRNGCCVLPHSTDSG